MPDRKDELVLIDGSRIMTEASVRAGAEVFIGYPITPANLIYLYATQRFPITLSAPDEITVLQWMAGFSATGKIPVTATSFPGFALMMESINMAYMMELPMVVVLVQRLGPSTGTATCGAQGDLLLLRGMISGGHPIPTICISDFDDCWNLSASAVSIASELRTPVVLLTSKEMVMTLRSFDISGLSSIGPVRRRLYNEKAPYRPYAKERDSVPAFLPVGNIRHQVRFTASTHDTGGLLRHSTDEAMANTRRLPEKIVEGLPDFTYYDLDEMDGSGTLIFSYGISSAAAREAVCLLRERGIAVSLLIAKTLFPVPPEYHEIMDGYERIIFAEENLNGQYCEILFGAKRPPGVSAVGSIGKMITPRMLIDEVEGASEFEGTREFEAAREVEES